MTYETDRLRNAHAIEVQRLRRVVAMLILWGDSEPTLDALESWWGHEDPRDKRRANVHARTLLRAVRQSGGK